MRTKILAAFVAGGLLVGAGLVTSVISVPGTAQAQEESEPESDDHPFPRVLGLLDEVLAVLVDEGTLTEEQADSVASAAAAKAEEVREQHRSLRERLREEHPRAWRPFAHGFRFGALFDDGGIDQEEYDGLDEDHPLKQLDLSEYLEDGLITPEELREILPDLRELRGKDT